jgi:type IV pilus assembly protein PilV
MTMLRGKIFMQNKHQCGFTLLEVLIALLVLSIGLLGLAALQTIGLRSNQMASTRTTATQLAYDITDRMRANEAATGLTRDLATGDITYSKASDDYLIAHNTSDPTAPVDCAAAQCDTQQLALFDLAQWRAAVALLPGGKSQIVCENEAGNPCADGKVNFPHSIHHTITVYWDEERKKVTGVGCDPDNPNDLRCIQLTM